MTRATRRAVLVGGASGAVAAFLFGTPAAEAAVTSRPGLYVRSRFTAARRRTFVMSGPTGTWRVRLIAVEDLAHSPRGSEDCFTLVFRTRRQGPPQGCYTVRRATNFRPTTLFVVPNPGRRTYEAVINRGH